MIATVKYLMLVRNFFQKPGTLITDIHMVTKSLDLKVQFLNQAFELIHCHSNGTA